MSSNISDASGSILASEAPYRELVACPFCGGNRYTPITEPRPSTYGKGLEPVFAGMAFQVVKCTDCDTAYQRNRPKPDHIGLFYPKSDYHCYESLLDRGPIIRAGAMASARKVVRQIEELRPKKSNMVVDFGCGSGSWIELFRLVKAPWETVGTEIFPELCEMVEKSGSRCFVADHETIDSVFEPDSVDALFMHHVIEHIPNPLRFLEKARKVLVPGGVIFGQTPNWRCLEERIFRTDWVQWHQPHHLVVFDPRTMRKHAEAAGFEVVEITRSLSSATQWSASLLNWWSRIRKREYRVTKEPLHAPLTAAFLPVTLLQSFVADVSHMDFVLRKKR